MSKGTKPRHAAMSNAREHRHVEWKESWRDDYLRWICGFANAEGGVLVIGRNDKGVAVGVDRAALITLRDCDGYMNLAPALPWIAAWLAGEDAWRRQKARDFLVGYVVKPWRLSQGPNTLKLRARDVLAAVSGIDNDEARAVVRHCREKSE